MTSQREKLQPHTSDQGILCVLEYAGPGGSSRQLNFSDLVRAVTKRRWWILAATATATLVAVAYVLLSDSFYRAEAIVMPREREGGAGLSTQLGQLAGLAQLAGISVGKSAGQEPIGILTSRGFAQRFIERQGLVGELSKKSSGNGMNDQREMARLVDRFTESVLDVSEDKKTGLIVISIEWKNAALAAAWANGIVRQVNEESRLRSLQEAVRNIEYLRGELASTSAVSLQAAIARLLEIELQKVMLAKGTDEYAFRVIDQAAPPAVPIRPKRALIIAVAFFSGLLLSICIALLVDPVREAFQTADRT